MAISAQAPADTAMMGIVHSALRRDLTRTSDAVSADSAPGDVQRQAIARHLVWMMSFLHRHHAGEDDGLWPLVRRHDPNAGALLEEMDADHARINPQLESVASAGKRYGSDSSTQARQSLLAAIASLRHVLDPHLLKEEEEAMPVVSSVLTHAVGSVQPGALCEAENEERVGAGRPLADRRHRSRRVHHRGGQRFTNSALRTVARFRRSVCACMRDPMGRRCKGQATAGGDSIAFVVGHMLVRSSSTLA
jgi:hemerythrin-like domain-containing protein